MANKIILIGGGGHCKNCIDIIEQENKFQIAGILDVADKVGQKVLGYEIIGTDEEIEKYVKEGFFFLVTIGYLKKPEIRFKKFQELEAQGAKIATVISPFAYVSKYSQIKAGTVVMHHALVNSTSKIGKNCIINSKALLEHDCVIGDNCHISTGAIINGDCVIGEESFIGSNATVVNGVSVSPKSFIKAGALVK